MLSLKVRKSQRIAREKAAEAETAGGIVTHDVQDYEKKVEDRIHSIDADLAKDAAVR